MTALQHTGPAMLDADPPGFVRMLVAQLMASWDTAAARQLISLMSHDGLTHDALLTGAIEESLGSLAGIFQHWMAAGYITPGLGEPADLAYARMAPVVQARLLWLHADATPQDRQTARDRATRHAEFFARAAFQPGQ